MDGYKLAEMLEQQRIRLAELMLSKARACTDLMYDVNKCNELGIVPAHLCGSRAAFERAAQLILESRL